MRALVLSGLAATALSVTPAMAGDRLGYQAISAGDLNAAERTLVAERRIFPNRPELMLNLAAVYDRTGREAEARALYTSLLQADDVELTLANGTTASSRVLASTGLARLGRTIAAR